MKTTRTLDGFFPGILYGLANVQKPVTDPYPSR